MASEHPFRDAMRATTAQYRSPEEVAKRKRITRWVLIASAVFFAVLLTAMLRRDRAAEDREYLEMVRKSQTEEYQQAIDKTKRQIAH